MSSASRRVGSPSGRRPAAIPGSPELQGWSVGGSRCPSSTARATCHATGGRPGGADPSRGPEASFRAWARARATVWCGALAGGAATTPARTAQAPPSSGAGRARNSSSVRPSPCPASAAWPAECSGPVAWTRRPRWVTWAFALLALGPPWWPSCSLGARPGGVLAPPGPRPARVPRSGAPAVVAVAVGLLGWPSCAPPGRLRPALAPPPLGPRPATAPGDAHTAGRLGAGLGVLGALTAGLLAAVQALRPPACPSPAPASALPWRNSRRRPPLAAVAARRPGHAGAARRPAPGRAAGRALEPRGGQAGAGPPALPPGACGSPTAPRRGGPRRPGRRHRQLDAGAGGAGACPARSGARPTAGSDRR